MAFLNKLRKARKDEEANATNATQRSRRASGNKNRKKSVNKEKDAQQREASVRQQSIRKKKPSKSQQPKVRRKLTGQKQPSEAAEDDGKVSRDEAPRQPQRKQLPPERTTCSTEAIALIREIQDQGKIETEFDDMKTACKEFALHAASILTKGALEEYAVHLRNPPECTRESYDKNVPRNRYRDVICGDQERVVLNGPYSSVFNDYIHANHVRGPPLNPDQHFILTQGPTDKTIYDFWRMVYQEKSCAIVMLCDLVECGKDKCASYWPIEDGASLRMDAINLMVTNLGRFVHEPGLVTTVLNVRNLKTGNDFQVLHHIWRGWPDRGVPDKHESVLKILQLVRACKNGTSTVVHCSAGIGRTGTVVAVELAIQSLIQNKCPDLWSLVRNLRQKRLQSVQTDLQYAFVYKVVLAFIASRDPDSETLVAIDNYHESFTAMVQGMKMLERQVECDHHVAPIQ